MLYIPLDLLKTKEIRLYKQRYEAILNYYYKHYSHFQNERAKHFDDIRNAILENSSTYSFNCWHRIVALQYMDNPLSARGSLLNDPGGRFNIGDIDELRYPKFPALYIAENFETAFRERFQIESAQKLDCGLTAEELVLTNQASSIDLMVTGNTLCVYDLSDEKVLEDFYKIIKQIKLPRTLLQEARRLNITPMRHIQTYLELRRSILESEWRRVPMQLDIPANSQILGHLIHTCGIEGVIYPSRMSSTQKCMAIFPQNFRNSSNYVKIQDKKVPQNIKIIELNSETYMNLY